MIWKVKARIQRNLRPIILPIVPDSSIRHILKNELKLNWNRFTLVQKAVSLDTEDLKIDNNQDTEDPARKRLENLVSSDEMVLLFTNTLNNKIMVCGWKSVDWKVGNRSKNVDNWVAMCQHALSASAMFRAAVIANARSPLVIMWTNKCTN